MITGSNPVPSAISRLSIMDNTKSFYLLNVSSILAGETTYGVVSVKVNTTDCDSVNTGSIPVRLPISLIVFFEVLDPINSSFMIAKIAPD